jgi:hypothetical protein
MKKLKGWVAISETGDVTYTDRLPDIYLQKTKPVVWDEYGKKIKVVSCTLTIHSK